MRRTVAAGSSPAMQDYLATLVYPFGNKSRIPDSYSRSTAVVSSTASFSVPVSSLNAADPDYGRFALAVQPHMGSLAKPLSYKAAIAAPVPGAGGLWSAVDWSSPNAYLDQIDGTDPRLDQYYTSLTQAPLGAYLIQQGASANTPFPIAGTSPFEDSIQVWSHYNTFVTMQSGSPNGSNDFRVAPGQYNMHFDARVVGTTFSSGPSISVLVGTAADLIISIPRSITSTDATLATYDALITVKKTLTIRLTAPLTSYAVNYTNITMSLTPTFFTAATDGGTSNGAGFVPDAYPSGKYGLVTEYRTVGMSVLVTYEGTTLNDGGMISAAYVSGGSAETNFFTNAPSVSTGALQNWENLAKYPRAYSDRLCDGAYVMWHPEDPLDLCFHDPDYCAETLAESPPTLIVSGIYTPNAAITNPKVIRLLVSTVYEITTLTQLFPQQILVGSTNIMDEVNRAISTQPTAMANATHLTWLKDFWGGLKTGLGYAAAPARWVFNNRDSIATALA